MPKDDPNSVAYWKELYKQWKEISDTWENISREKEKSAIQARSLLLAASILHADCPHLDKYSKLLRTLFVAADSVYVTTKVSSVSDEKIHSIMAAIRNLNEALIADGLQSIRIDDI